MLKCFIVQPMFYLKTFENTISSYILQQNYIFCKRAILKSAAKIYVSSAFSLKIMKKKKKQFIFGIVESHETAS